MSFKSTLISATTGILGGIIAGAYLHGCASKPTRISSKDIDEDGRADYIIDTKWLGQEVYFGRIGSTVYTKKEINKALEEELEYRLKR